MEAWNSKLYVFGGEEEEEGSIKITNTLRVFDLETRKWSKILNQNPPSSRKLHGSIVDQDNLYVFGGRSQLEALADISRYSFDREVWDHMSVSSSQQPTARWGSAMCQDLDGSILIIGGSISLSHSNVQNDVWRFSPDSFSWKEVKSESKMQSVALHNAFAYQGRILILFGIGSDGNPLSNYYQAIIDTYYKPAKRIANDFFNMKTNRSLCDCSLKVDDKEIPVHKFVVFARCPALMRLIQAQNDHLKVTGASFESVSIILDYLYGDRIPSQVSVECALATLDLCQQWELFELFRHLELLLVKQLKESNVIFLLKTGNKLNLQTLVVACLIFVQNNKNSILNSPDFVWCDMPTLIQIAEQIFPN